MGTDDLLLQDGCCFLELCGQKLCLCRHRQCLSNWAHANWQLPLTSGQCLQAHRCPPAKGASWQCDYRQLSSENGHHESDVDAELPILGSLALSDPGVSVPLSMLFITHQVPLKAHGSEMIHWHARIHSFPASSRRA